MNCTNCYTVEFIYTVFPQTYTICGRIFMKINYLPAGGAVGVVESRGLLPDSSPRVKKYFRVSGRVQVNVKWIASGSGL